MSCTGTSTTLALVKAVSVLFDRVEIKIYTKDEADAKMCFKVTAGGDEAVIGHPDIGIQELDTSTTIDNFIFTNT